MKILRILFISNLTLKIKYPRTINNIVKVLIINNNFTYIISTNNTNLWHKLHESWKKPSFSGNKNNVRVYDNEMDKNNINNSNKL